jgi:hypothetical protein
MYKKGKLVCGISCRAEMSCVPFPPSSPTLNLNPTKRFLNWFRALQLDSGGEEEHVLDSRLPKVATVSCKLVGLFVDLVPFKVISLI